MWKDTLCGKMRFMTNDALFEKRYIIWEKIGIDSKLVEVDDSYESSREAEDSPIWYKDF